MIVAAPDAPRVDEAALRARHAESGAVVTIALERRPDVAGAGGVAILAGDGRVVGYQPRPAPAEALSDLVDVGVHLVGDEAADYLDGAAWSAAGILLLLEQDVPVYGLVLP